MPAYDYFCTDCKQEFEATPKYDDRDSVPCIECNLSTTVVRKVSAPAGGFRNYDGGFYKRNIKADL